jgi:class 3 adenylate cyclase
VKTVGDGFVATFDSPSRAIQCALAIRDTSKTFDIDVRGGIHTGELEVRGDDVAGMAVHIGARVSALAEPGSILVSSTVKDSVIGSKVEFEEREVRTQGSAGHMASLLLPGLTRPLCQKQSEFQERHIFADGGLFGRIHDVA